jgi:amino acid adenylation domain-containing protein
MAEGKSKDLSNNYDGVPLNRFIETMRPPLTSVYARAKFEAGRLSGDICITVILCFLSRIAGPHRAIRRVVARRSRDRWEFCMDDRDNDNRARHEGGRTALHELVERQATANPDAPAVSFTDGDTTHDLAYRELNERANVLARRLRTFGIGIESRVAVALPRSPDLVVAVLAVLKAGGAYVPLDADYPAQRRMFMLADTRAEAVITDRASGADLVRTEGAPPMVLIDDPADADPAARENLGVRVRSDNAAYVIYTSGSTGTPKGVVVDHGSVVALVLDDPRLAVRPGDVVAQLAPIAFDASTFELWCALGRGGRVAILGGAHLSADELGEQLRRWRPGWLFLTTGLFHLLVDHDLGALRSVGCLITGGDVLSPQHIRAAAALPNTTVYAAYGPTETTVYASLHLAEASSEYERVPIGAPLTGKTMRLLGDDLREVPAGEVGEIYLAGKGVARCYHDRPTVTASRFVADPFAADPGLRMYRTGDLGRRLPNGELEFWGRTDRQVKIRGFRVELGEIETALSAHEQVAAAAALGVEGADGTKRLVAYVTPATGAEPVASELRLWLETKLPAYMIPATVLVLDKLPLDPNGKLDRRALPYPWASRADLGDLPEYVAPRNEVERLMAAVWAESLGLDAVGMDDNFFELGGDSLRSVDVLARLQDNGISLSALAFFERPTIGELAGLAVPSEV